MTNEEVCARLNEMVRPWLVRYWLRTVEHVVRWLNIELDRIASGLPHGCELVRPPVVGERAVTDARQHLRSARVRLLLAELAHDTQDPDGVELALQLISEATVHLLCAWDSVDELLEITSALAVGSERVARVGR